MKNIDVVIRKVLNEYLKKNVRMVNENNHLKNHYMFYNMCTDMDADEVQEITRWDEYSNNDYAIQDDYFNDGIYIIPTNEFLDLIKREYQPSIDEIDYCVYNEIMDILFCLTKKGIHYFYI